MVTRRSRPSGKSMIGLSGRRCFTYCVDRNRGHGDLRCLLRLWQFLRNVLCFRPKRSYNVGYIRCDRATLLRDRRNYYLIWTALPERLEAPSHRNHISDTWAFDVLAVVRGSLAVEIGDGIRSLGCSRLLALHLHRCARCRKGSNMSSHRLLHRCGHVAGFEDALLPDLNPQ
jgi:hypothetical protein